MESVVLMGTAHRIQLGLAGDVESFEKRLTALCQTFKVRAIGEEMSTAALAAQDVARTIGAKVAQNLNLPHIYCDLPLLERRRLGISTVQEIQHQAHVDMWSKDQLADRLSEHFASVERYWLEQLRQLNTWPVLYVCGANHVASFAQVLQNDGFVCSIAETDWGA